MRVTKPTTTVTPRTDGTAAATTSATSTPEATTPQPTDGFDETPSTADVATAAPSSTSPSGETVRDAVLPQDVQITVAMIEMSAKKIEEVAAQDGERMFATDYEVGNALHDAREVWMAQEKKAPHPAATDAYHALLARVCDDCFTHLKARFEHSQQKPFAERRHSFRADYSRSYQAVVHGGGKSEYEPFTRYWNELAQVDSPAGHKARRQLAEMARIAASAEEGAWQDSGLVSSSLKLEDRVALLSFDRHRFTAHEAQTLLDAAKQANADGDAAFASRILRELSDALPSTMGVSLAPLRRGLDEREKKAATRNAIIAFDEKYADRNITFDFREQIGDEISELRKAGVERRTIQEIDFLLGDMRLASDSVATQLGYKKKSIERSKIPVPAAQAHVDAALAKVAAFRTKRNVATVDRLLGEIKAGGLLSLNSESFRELSGAAWKVSQLAEESGDNELSAVVDKAKTVVEGQLDSARKAAAKHLADARSAPIDVDTYIAQNRDLWTEQHVLEEAENFVDKRDRAVQKGRFMDHAELVVEQMARLLEQTPNSDQDEQLQKLIRGLKSTVEYGVDDYILPDRAKQLRARFTEVTGVDVD